MRRQSSDPVFDWLAYYAEYDPGRLAAVDLATRRWLTYRQFDERATRLATALRERFGVEHGDRVAFLAHNSSDHFEAMFACWKLGAIFVPLNWRLRRTRWRPSSITANRASSCTMRTSRRCSRSLSCRP